MDNLYAVYDLKLFIKIEKKTHLGMGGHAFPTGGELGTGDRILAT